MSLRSSDKTGPRRPGSAAWLYAPRTFLLACALATTACAGGASGRALPVYGTTEATLFGDTIEPAAMGMDLVKSYDPKADPQLKQRARQADAIVRVRVQTVSTRDSELGTSYELTLRYVQGADNPAGAEVIGPHRPEDPFKVVIEGKSQAAGMVRAAEGGLVGKTFVAFVKRFARAEGEGQLHFHLAPDNKATIVAVTDAIATAGLAGKE